MFRLQPLVIHREIQYSHTYVMFCMSRCTTLYLEITLIYTEYIGWLSPTSSLVDWDKRSFATAGATWIISIGQGGEVLVVLRERIEN